MKLEKLDIRLEQKYINGYCADPVPAYVGVVKFRQAIGNIEILLSEDQIKGIISVVGDSLVDAAKGVSKAMTDSILEETGAKLKITK